MATTPTIWASPLAAAFLAGFLAVVSAMVTAVLTQRNANRREDARWQREREREQALWAREDAARSYDHRREAYVAFIKEFHHRWKVSIEVEQAGFPTGDPPEDFFVPVYDLLTPIEIFGTKEAARLAEEACQTLSARAFTNHGLPPDVLGPFQSEIRRDLSIPDRPA